MAMTLTIIWYAASGHHPDVVAEHRARSPWYLTKTTPSFDHAIGRGDRCPSAIAHSGHVGCLKETAGIGADRSPRRRDRLRRHGTTWVDNPAQPHLSEGGVRRRAPGDAAGSGSLLPLARSSFVFSPAQSGRALFGDQAGARTTAGGCMLLGECAREAPRDGLPRGASLPMRPRRPGCTPRARDAGGSRRARRVRPVRAVPTSCQWGAGRESCSCVAATRYQRLDHGT